MSEVSAFRPSSEERAIIDRVKRAHGFRTEAEALRYLVRRGAEAEAIKRPTKLLAFRVPKRFRDGRTTTVEEIDAALYGDDR